MALSAPPETRFGREKSAEEIDRELAEKFNGVKFRRAALDEVGYEGILSIECFPIPDGETAAREGIKNLKAIAEKV